MVSSSALLLASSPSCLELSPAHLLSENAQPLSTLQEASGAWPSTETILQPDEMMNAVLPHAVDCLDNATTAWAEGRLDETCTHLQEASSLLQALISAVGKGTPKKVPQVISAKEGAGSVSQPIKWTRVRAIAA